MPADEFALVRDLFAPLATHAGARGLIDDAALFADHVVTADAIVEGVHFLRDDPIELIAQKALRVNLSDVAAKGARPVAALLTLIWPDHRASSDIAAFAHGLGDDLARFNLALLGGDTTRTPGPLTIAITAFGAPCGARVPARADARAGDDLWDSGTIGDAWLGLGALRDEIALAPDDAAFAIGRYRLPQPRVALAPLIAAEAHGAMDVSDGLSGDGAKLAAASRVQLRIEAERVPLSQAAQAWRRSAQGAWGRLLDFGDDYEILFTADRSRRAAIAHASADAGVPLTRIGSVMEGEGAIVVDANGAPLPLGGGHEHRLGR